MLRQTTVVVTVCKSNIVQYREVGDALYYLLRMELLILICYYKA